MKVLIIDDEKNIRNATSMAIKAEGHEAETADTGRIALLKLAEEKYDLGFLDLRLGDENGLDVLVEMQKIAPSMPVVIFTAYASVETAVEGMRRGAFDYLEKPFTPDHLRVVIDRVDKTRKLKKKVERLESEVAQHDRLLDYESQDVSMQRALDVLFRAADTPASVLILGESGTGKSVLARAVHQHSNIKDQAFVTVSCPSLSRELLESDLFGHIKGSFTGATKDTWGKVAAAQDGALFLDEIGELPMEIQPKLLRLLQERQYERVGENTTRTASVRVIAATNRNLDESVKAGSFREDLFYRLNVITVTIPPLRERPLDLIRLSRRYLEHFSKEMQRPASTFSPEALSAIQAYSWPGNLRELRNVIERSVILARGESLTIQDLPDTFHPGSNHANGTSIHPGSPVSIDELEAEHIRRIIAQTDSLESASRILGIDPATLYRKRKKMSL